MRFTDEFIRRVMEANNVVDIISQYTQLKPSGGGLMGRCPFPDHQEKTPSFSVSEHKQVYHCFGCHKSGNLITFLRDYHGYSFPEAVEWLAKRASIPMPEKDVRSSAEDAAAAKRKKLFEVNRLALQFFAEQLKRTRADHYSRQYIAKRGLTEETVEAFQIGFAPREWDGLLAFLISKNVPPALAEEARLIVARKDGKSGHFDMFRDRLMFPILNTMGEAVAFGGRVLNPEDNPKYLNSPETPVFEKKKVLYGLHQTARYIRSDDLAVIVEGYMDAVSLYQAGVKNVAAVMSSSLTPEQARLLKRMTRNVVMLLDGDNAGVDGAERSLPILLQGDLYPKGVFLPDNMDPDDFVKSQGVEALRELLDRAQDLLFVVLDRWMENYRGEPPEKLKLVDKLKPVLNGIADRRLRELYLQEIARRLNVQLPWLRQALDGSAAAGPDRVMSGPRGIDPRRGPAVSPPRGGAVSGPLAAEEKGSQIILKGAPSAELTAMALSLKSRANFEIFARESVFDWFAHEGVRKILLEAQTVYGQDQERFDRLSSLLVSTVDQPGLLFAREPSGPKGPEEVDTELEVKWLRDALRRVREMHLRGQLQKLRAELARDPSPEKLESLANLQKDISSLTKG
ncbi:MAG: DNA primase [Bdellovibrionaceae bacterium]|nr:DNA primase [Pseudobdellovibrionaceae bacterium]MBX3034931.1 DNA primase [Pseudobdellovibrionaceae bacterium]